MTKDEALGPEGRRLLTTQKNLLVALDQQRAFLLKQAMRKPPCPWPTCQRPVSQIEAAGPGWTVEGPYSDTAYTCPHCEQRLSYVLPLIGASWFWMPGAEPCSTCEGTKYVIDSNDRQVRCPDCGER